MPIRNNINGSSATTANFIFLLQLADFQAQRLTRSIDPNKQ